jgi:sortase A
VGQGRIWTRIGGVLLGTGCLIIAFVAFQLWGTALYTDHTQSNLRSQIDHELGLQPPSLGSLRSALPGSDPKAGTGEKGSGSSLPAVATNIAKTTAQPPVGQPIGILAIPKLGLDDVVVQGYGEAQLQGGPGHYPGTALPGQAGNAAIAGHRTTFAAPFYNLNQLVPGDPIFVLTSQGLFRYNVIGSHIVLPTDSAVLDSSTTPELTLTTCNPRYSASERLVVVAVLDLATAHSGHQAPAPPATGGGQTSKGTTPKPKAAIGATDATAGDPVLPAVLWAIITLIAALVLRLVSRRLRGPVRWAAYLVGVPLVLAALFVCFEHVSLALPASF